MRGSLDRAVCERLSKSPRLSGVSRPVLEAVVREALDALCALVPDVDEVLTQEWAPCDACRRISPEDTTWRGEDVTLCAECYDAAKEDA